MAQQSAVEFQPVSPSGAAIGPPTVQSGELLHIDMTRFIASFGIVLVHSLEFFGTGPGRTFIQQRFAGLALFVDVFFVISGFIISFVYSGRVRTAAEYGAFMQRRFGRLLPLHWAMLLVWIAVILALWGAAVPMKHTMSLHPACLWTGALLLHSFVNCGGIVPNGVSWSLSAELMMYLCFPLFSLLQRRSVTAWGGAAVALAIALAVAPLDRWNNYVSVLRALAPFLIGMAAYRDRVVLARIGQTSWLLWAALAAFVLAGPLGFPVLMQLPLAYAIALLAIAADLAGRTSAAVRWVSPLGQLTYSMYMIHPLLVMIVMNAVGDKLLHLTGAPMAVLALITYAAIMALSVLSFRLFETPARRWIDRVPLFPRPART